MCYVGNDTNASVVYVPQVLEHGTGDTYKLDMDYGAIVDMDAWAATAGNAIQMVWSDSGETVTPQEWTVTNNSIIKSGAGQIKQATLATDGTVTIIMQDGTYYNVTDTGKGNVRFQYPVPKTSNDLILLLI